MNRLKRWFGVGDKDFYQLFFKLLIPLVIQQGLASMLFMVDNLMIGRLGETPIAAISVANQLSFMLQVVVFGVTSGAGILSAQFYGKKDLPSVGKAAGLALTSAFAVGVVFATFAAFQSETFMRFFSKDEAVVRLGAQYIRISALGFIFRACSLTFGAILKSCENVKLPMVATGVSVIVNTCLNYCLIFGNFGFPKLGVNGAAIATLIACTVEVLIVGGVCLKKYHDVFNKMMFRFQSHLTKRYIRLGLPVLLNEVLWSSGILMYTVFYGKIGTSALAASQIFRAIDTMGVVLLLAIGNSTAIMIGNMIGEGKIALVKQYTKRLLCIGLLTGVVVGILVIVFSPLYVNIYNVSDAVRLDAMKLITVYAVFLWVFMTEHTMIIGVLRAGGDTIYSSIVDSLAMWALTIPALFTAGLVFHLPLWASYACASSVGFVKMYMYGRRIKSWKWVKDLTDTTS